MAAATSPYPLPAPICHAPHSTLPTSAPSSGETTMAGRERKFRARRSRPAAPVAAPMPIPAPIPVELLPLVEEDTPEAHAEILRVVREKFPDRGSWPAVCVEIILHSTFAERARFSGDDGGMDYQMIFWAIQEAESTDPVQAAKWRRYKTRNPSRLNIRRPSVVGLANLPPGVLPPGVSPPRLP